MAKKTEHSGKARHANMSLDGVGDDSWLSTAQRSQRSGRPLTQEMTSQEKELIEAALAECKGRVSGPAGAAANLGMPPSTLDSKIRTLKIDKHSFYTN